MVYFYCSFSPDTPEAIFHGFYSNELFPRKANSLIKVVSLALLSSWLCGNEPPELCCKLCSVGLCVEFETNTCFLAWHGLCNGRCQLIGHPPQITLPVGQCLNTGLLLRWTGSLKAHATKQSKPNTVMSKADKGFPTSIVYFVNEWAATQWSGRETQEAQMHKL